MEVMPRVIWDARLTEENVLDWLESCGWCWGLGVPADSTKEDLANARKRGWHIIQELYAHPGTRKRDALYKQKSIPDVKQVIEKAYSAVGPDLTWQIFLEDDSAGVAFPQVLMQAKPRTHSEAKDVFDSYLDEAIDVARDFPHIEQWGVAGFASSAHAYARHGIKCVIVERANDDVDDLQTAIAFARGASKQYGCKWGIDLSLWWGVIHGCVQNLGYSFHRRNLFISYFSGTQEYRIEGGGLSLNPGTAIPNKLGETFDKFFTFASQTHPGQIETPVAIILPEDNGWITPPYWRTNNEAWNYARIPYRPGDRGIDGFFGAAFPGSVYAMDPFPAGRYEQDNPPASPFALSCVTPDFAPEPGDIYNAHPPLPFGRYKNRGEARQMMSDRDIDPSPYRPMGDSRWGDIFDVFTDEVSSQVLCEYPVAVLLGAIEMTESLKDRLKSYVESGGILKCAAGVVGPDDVDLTGVILEPELHVGRAWTWGKPVAEAYRYCPGLLDDESNTEIVAYTQTGEPLITRKTLGKGYIYTCMMPWYEAGHISLSKAALLLLER